MRAALVLFGMVLGCVPSPTTSRPDVPGADTGSGCDGAWYPDADGDGFGDGRRGGVGGCSTPEGYVEIDGDCDDADPAVFPGAAETCDGVDQDCDAVVDDYAVDAPPWYGDSDGDGFGDPDAASPIASCDPLPGHVADATDCDDRNADTRPDAYEHCDGVDQDCDGVVDEDSANAETFYLDLDGDGWGDLASPVNACEAPPGAVAGQGDCDDADPLAAPDAPELCGGGDEDCDGAVDEDDAIDAPTWYADADGDGHGDPAAPSEACSAPADAVADASDCDDGDPGVSPDAVETCDGVDQDCDGAVDDDGMGPSAFYADLDGDGWGDPASPVFACEAPAGSVTVAGDCDDTDAGVSPAALERCGGADEDCDGTVDEDDAIDAPTWYADDDRDGFGDAAAPHVSCEAPFAHAANDVDCDDADLTVSPAAEEVCGGADEDCDGEVDEGAAVDASTWYRDADVDGRGDPDTTVRACTRAYGYVETGTDCDDGNPAAHADLPELCATAFDDDCDGVVNEADAADAAPFCVDADGDGYGDVRSTVRACTASPGIAANDDDCDDTDPAVSPDAVEVCGGGDENCDGRSNGGDAVDALSLYRDVDRDGHGGTSYAAMRSCVVSTGYATLSDDCLDSDASVYPGAPEDCSNDVDEDCDGATDDGEVCVPWYADADGDGYGDAAVTTCQCGTTDAYPAAEAGDCDDADAAAYPGAPEVWGDTADAACDGDAVDGLLSANGVALYGTGASGNAGRAVAPAGDLDGDGLPDLFVGGGPGAGSAYVLFGAPTGALSLDAADLILDGETPGAGAGHVVDAGDIDGDGAPDLLVGASNEDVHGAVYVVRSPGTGDVALATADVTVFGTTGHDLTGWGGFLGDLDGDGIDELGTGAPRANGRAPGAGAFFVLSPLEHGEIALTDGDVFTGIAAGAAAGTAADGLGDVDGDGLDDFAVGAPNGTTGGVVYVLTGPLVASDLESAATHRFDTAGSYVQLGASVRGPGDVDGDGLADLLVGAPTPTEGASRSYLFTTLATGSAAGWATTVFAGTPRSFGAEVDAGDFDGDGVIDVAISEMGSFSTVGVVHILFAPPSGTVSSEDADVVLRGSSGGYAGASRALAVVGDADGDGKDDLLVGEKYDDTAYTNAGVAWFVAGR